MRSNRPGGGNAEKLSIFRMALCGGAGWLEFIFFSRRPLSCRSKSLNRIITINSTTEIRQSASARKCFPHKRYLKSCRPTTVWAAVVAVALETLLSPRIQNKVAILIIKITYSRLIQAYFFKTKLRITPFPFLGTTTATEADLYPAFFTVIVYFPGANGR